MKLEVGSIIYIIDPKKTTIVPAKIQEQIVSRTVMGEKVSHNVEVPSGKLICLEELNTSFFTSLEEVRSHLLEKAEKVIDLGIKSAQKIATEKFAIEMPSENESLLMNSMDKNFTEESLSVTLEDGTKANIKLPTEFLGENISS